ncbi:MAG: hypothetical protein Q8P22_10305 [Chloroflexota bacterium]|nr:hypothetical protein [Chloroflexota bacterium]
MKKDVEMALLVAGQVYHCRKCGKDYVKPLDGQKWSPCGHAAALQVRLTGAAEPPEPAPAPPVAQPAAPPKAAPEPKRRGRRPAVPTWVEAQVKKEHDWIARQLAPDNPENQRARAEDVACETAIEYWEDRLIPMLSHWKKEAQALGAAGEAAAQGFEMLLAILRDLHDQCATRCPDVELFEPFKKKEKARLEVTPGK